MITITIAIVAWALVVAFLALIAGTFEDLESDVGSQSNPNSQVQLAAQIGYVNRFFNKAISGEPPAYGVYCAVSAGIAWLLLSNGLAAILAIPIGAGVAAIVHVTLASTAHLGRASAQKRFEQPIYMDVFIKQLLPIATHGFVAVLSITTICYIQASVMPEGLQSVFPMPLLGLIWGITIGSIGSSVGDVHYGTEREFQDRPFGEGKRVTYHGKITRYAECGIRNQNDIVYFCAKHGGPVTGLVFGSILLFENWRSLLGLMIGMTPEAQVGWSIGIGVGIVIVLIVINYLLVGFARKKYGEFVGE